MPLPEEPKKDQPNTYFVQDRSNEAEFERLHIADQNMTRGMGGVFAEQADPTRFHRILDVACGTGGWLIEAAQTYPFLSRCCGVDISAMMITRARARALANHLEDRVDFAVQDALLLLEFPDGYFDLVNQRNATSFLRIWDWQKMIGECCRVTAQGGTIRLTESDFIVETSGAVTAYLFELILEAFYRAGHLFARDTTGITSHLVSILNRYAQIRDVSTRMHKITYHAGTPEWENMATGIKLTFQTVTPFLKKWGRLPDNYDTLYQQASHELDQPDASATMGLLTAWGERDI